MKMGRQSYIPLRPIIASLSRKLALKSSIVASYDYSPFGQLIATSGTPELSPIQFSSENHRRRVGDLDKRARRSLPLQEVSHRSEADEAMTNQAFDPETALTYYNHRYYNPTDGRWLSRDPAGESASFNLYTFVNNASIYRTDYLGLITYVEIDSFFGHAWLRLGEYEEIESIVSYNGKKYYTKTTIPVGKGFYPAENGSNSEGDGLSKQLTLAFDSVKGVWSDESEKELAYTLFKKFSMVEYQVKTYSSMWYTPKIKYGGGVGVNCSCSNSKVQNDCIMNHPDMTTPSKYNLIYGNCRERAKMVLKDCCLEIDSKTKKQQHTEPSNGVNYEDYKFIFIIFGIIIVLLFFWKKNNSLCITARFNDKLQDTL